MTYNLLLIGCGNMAGAMLSGWLDAGLVARAVIIKPTPLSWSNPLVEVHTPVQGVPSEFAPELVVLGVKPQTLGEVLPAYRTYAGKAPFLSLAVGKPLIYFEDRLGPDAAIIRAMPNLPATVRKGVTGCTLNDVATPEHRQMTTELLQAIGSVHWIAESEMDALAALASSGPAYLFLLEEVLAEAGKRLGLAGGLAASLARETIIGSAELLARSDEDAATLRARVTSKGGVTAPALQVLMQNDALMELFAEALEANVRRAKELAEI